MEQIKYIRKCVLKKGESINKVAKKTGQDWRTVQKYVYKDNFNEEVKSGKKGKTKLDKVKPTSMQVNLLKQMTDQNFKE